MTNIIPPRAHDILDACPSSALCQLLRNNERALPSCSRCRLIYTYMLYMMMGTTSSVILLRISCAVYAQLLALHFFFIFCVCLTIYTLCGKSAILLYTAYDWFSIRVKRIYTAHIPYTHIGPIYRYMGLVDPEETRGVDWQHHNAMSLQKRARDRLYPFMSSTAYYEHTMWSMMRADGLLYGEPVKIG